MDTLNLINSNKELNNVLNENKINIEEKQNNFLQTMLRTGSKLCCRYRNKSITSRLCRKYSY